MESVSLHGIRPSEDRVGSWRDRRGTLGSVEVGRAVRRRQSECRQYLSEHGRCPESAEVPDLVTNGQVQHHPVVLTDNEMHH